MFIVNYALFVGYLQVHLYFPHTVHKDGTII